LGDPELLVTIFLCSKQSGKLAAASDSSLAPSLAQALIDRCGARTKRVRNALGRVTFSEKPKHSALSIVQAREINSLRRQLLSLPL
jgi:hypothetical protein